MDWLSHWTDWTLSNSSSYKPESTNDIHSVNKNSTSESRKKIVIDGLSDFIVQKIIDRQENLHRNNQELFDILRASLEVQKIISKDKKRKRVDNTDRWKQKEIIDTKLWYYNRAYNIAPGTIYGLYQRYKNTDIDDLNTMFEYCDYHRQEWSWCRTYLDIAGKNEADMIGLGTYVIDRSENILKLSFWSFTWVIKWIHQLVHDLWEDNIFKIAVEVIHYGLKIIISVNTDNDEDTISKEENDLWKYEYSWDLDFETMEHTIEFIRKLVGEDRDLIDHIIFR